MMSHRMSLSSSLLTLAVLLFTSSIKAEPPAREFPIEGPPPAAEPAQFRTHGGLPGEEPHIQKSVVFDVNVYEVDHQSWTNEDESRKRQDAFNELLSPWIAGRSGSTLGRSRVKVWATSETVQPDNLENLSPDVRLISGSKLSIHDGETGSFDYGGKTPQIRFYSTGGGDSRVQPLATTFVVESSLTDAGRILVSVFFSPDSRFRKTRSTIEELKRSGTRVTAEISQGQTLCLSDASPDYADNYNSLFIVITPTSIETREIEEAVRPLAARVPEPNVLEVTVEDRWPIADVKVGQRVVAVPVMSERTSLLADILPIQFSFEGGEATSQRVKKIEPLDDQTGRRVTVTVPFLAYDGIDDSVRKAVKDYVERLSSSTTTFVIPASGVSVTDVYDHRLATEFFRQIPRDFRPATVALTLNESFTAIGISSLIGESGTRTPQEIGPFSLELLDDDAGGFWRVTAKRIGTARLIQRQIGQEVLGPFRMTEYLVKKDTRELEIHLQQQFPSAKVSITPVGENALILKGSVASDDEVAGIVELAEQFTTTILNRLSVSAEQTHSAPGAVRHASAIVADPDSGPTTAQPLGERRKVEQGKSRFDGHTKPAESRRHRAESRKLRSPADKTQRRDRRRRRRA